MPRSIQKFEVSLKAFVLRRDAALFVRESDTGFWELPGGRIDVGEEMDPHATILAREIAEELGADFRFETGPDLVTWTRRRPVDGAYLFIIAHTCRHTDGELRLSPEHDDFAWLTADAWQALLLPPESAYRQGIAELFRRAALRRP